MIKLLFLVRGQIFKKQTKQTKSSSSVSEQKTFNLKSTNRYLQFKKIFLQNNVMFCLHAELPQPSALRVDVGRVSPPVHLRLLTLCHLPFVSSSSSFSLRSPQPAGRSHDENTSHTHTVEKCRQASVQSFKFFPAAQLRHRRTHLCFWARVLRLRLCQLQPLLLFLLFLLFLCLLCRRCAGWRFTFTLRHLPLPLQIRAQRSASAQTTPDLSDYCSSLPLLKHRPTPRSPGRHCLKTNKPKP